ncbi:hypothetical protein ABWJ16_002003 [Vibrio alginolyticus]
MYSNFDKVDMSNFPKANDVFYYFNVQCESLEEVNTISSLCNSIREDITVFAEISKGLSVNRNSLIKKIKSGIGIIADDDVKYEKEVFEKVRDAYLNDSVDFITFMIDTPYEESRCYKKYPSGNRKHTMFSLMRVSSIEITFNAESLYKKQVTFDTRFGLGSGDICKYEEAIFLNDLRKKGMKGNFVREYLVTHPYESSGKEKGYKSLKQINDKFCFFFRYFGLLGLGAALILMMKNPVTFQFGIKKLFNTLLNSRQYRK